MRITRIRIPAEYRTSDDRTHTAVADFKLGLGPCGKEVRELETRMERNGLEVHQYHTDGTAKAFFYPLATLTGRVEICYGGE